MTSPCTAAAAAKSLQSCPTLCDPIDGSPPGSPIPGVLQARTLEWVDTSFFNVWKWKVKVKLLSRIQLLATPWTAAYQAPPSIGFSRQVYTLPFKNRYLLNTQYTYLCKNVPIRNTYLNVHVQLFSHVRLFCDTMACSLPGSSVHGIS